MSSQAMTVIGCVSAGLAFMLASIPPETPVYVKLAIGCLNAILSFYLGKTNTGTK